MKGIETIVLACYLAVPTFKFEPDDIEVRPESNGRTVAAFSCSIVNHDRLEVRFQWIFTPRNSTLRIVLSNVDNNITILGMPALVDPRTSILILESVSARHEGSYLCQAIYCCGNLTSRGAELTFNGELSSTSLSRRKMMLGSTCQIYSTIVHVMFM